VLAVILAQGIGGCGNKEAPLAPRSQTWAELRTIRRTVKVSLPGESERAPYPRERLVDGEQVELGAEGLAWLRRDGGATVLIHGPARIKLRTDVLEVEQGRLFVDTPPGITTDVTTPNGPVHLADVRASLDIRPDQTTEAYVLAGEVRTDGGARAGAGERLTISGKAGATKANVAPALSWEDWTGGLATTDRSAMPAPYGVGTVGARRPGDWTSSSSTRARRPSKASTASERPTVQRCIASASTATASWCGAT
jgi:Ca-activated chloride channel family protein